MNVVLAAYGLPEICISNFMDWNKSVFEKHKVTVWVGYHKEFTSSVHKNLRIIKYPFKDDVFSIGRTVNYVIRRIEKCPEAGRIIKTDPDILFTDSLLQHVSDNVKPGVGMICICSNSESVEKASSTVWETAEKRKAGKGACFAMTKSDWHKLNGYDERIEGWGGDDEEMARRASKSLDLRVDWDEPLFHINHGQRKGIGSFPVRSAENMRHMVTNDWSSRNWGKPNYPDPV